jgi:hypothetical protein
MLSLKCNPTWNVNKKADIKRLKIRDNEKWIETMQGIKDDMIHGMAFLVRISRKLNFLEPDDSLNMMQGWVGWTRNVPELVKLVEKDFFGPEQDELLRKLIRITIEMNNLMAYCADDLEKNKGTLEMIRSFRMPFECIN